MQEVLHDYKHPLLHRPDTSLMSYGFVEPADSPLLCAIHLPSGYSANTNDLLYEGEFHWSIALPPLPQLGGKPQSNLQK